MSFDHRHEGRRTQAVKIPLIYYPHFDEYPKNVVIFANIDPLLLHWDSVNYGLVIGNGGPIKYGLKCPQDFNPPPFPSIGNLYI